MTWPGQRLWRPYVGLVTVLPREYYNEFDDHGRRPTVVVRVLSVERVCIVVTRTSQLGVPHHRDIWTDKDLDLLCDRQGWWQPWRSHRVNFAAYDDPEVGRHATMPEELLARIIYAYERCS
jgi:hypothetical protein